jgi:hypothetical protein
LYASEGTLWDAGYGLRCRKRNFLVLFTARHRLTVAFH